jgi:hypothetical protein
MRNSLLPDQWRCFVWGAHEGPAGTTGDAALQKLYDFLGATRLVDVRDQFSVEYSGELDVFAFETEDQQRAVVIAAPIGRQDRIMLKSVVITRAGLDEPESVGIWTLSEKGINPAGVKTEIASDHVKIIPGENPVELKGGESFLLEIVYGAARNG